MWLGNSRNTPAREHVDPAIQNSLKYWAFTVNELGEQDVRAFVDRIHKIKAAELRPVSLQTTARHPPKSEGAGKLKSGDFEFCRFPDANGKFWNGIETVETAGSPGMNR